MRAADSTIHAATDRLYTAISKLVDDQKQQLDGELHIAPGWYTQLADSVAAVSRREGYARGVGRSIAPVFCEALDLRTEIDAAVREWLPEEKSDTCSRLRALAVKKWPLEATRTVETMAARVEGWAAKIAALLAFERPKSLSAPCPSCNSTHVYRKDSIGETVRAAALQITTRGCVCVACNATWTPERYLFLCRLLGFELPDGVLE